MGVITYATPYFAIAIIPLSYMYIRFMNYFRNVSRETKRLESVSRSPIYAQFSETLGGLTTIRAYGQPKRFMNEFEKRVDKSMRASYSNKTADRWLATRLESLGAVISGVAALLATNLAMNGSGSASWAGLSLTYAININAVLNFGARLFARCEATMNATERIVYYTEDIQHEAPYTSEELQEKIDQDKKKMKKHMKKNNIDNDKDELSKLSPSTFAVVKTGGKIANKSTSWPEKGEIELR